MDERENYNERADRPAPLQVGDMIAWIDEATEKQFTGPGFNHGKGPFKITATNPGWSGNQFIVTFVNAKGQETKMDHSYFKKVNE